MAVDPEAPSRLTRDSAELSDLLVQTSFDIVAIVTRVGAERDLSLTQTRMLGILRDRNLRMADLADYLGLERSTVSGLVDRAEKRGLVERRPAASDGRSIELRLTDAGQQLAQDGAAVIAERIAPLVDRLPLALRPLDAADARSSSIQEAGRVARP